MPQFFERIPLRELPGWLGPLVAQSRPLAVTMLIAIPAAGAASVGAVAGFSPPRGYAMAAASVQFLQGIPDAAWATIATVALGYFGAKTWETTKAPPVPEGRPSPEARGEAQVIPVAVPVAVPVPAPSPATADFDENAAPASPEMKL